MASEQKNRVPDFEQVQQEVAPKGGGLHGAELHIQAAKRVFDAHSKLEQENTELKQENTYDELTGLPNEKTFGNRLESYVEKNSDENFCLVFIDLDRFKKINKRYGHKGADEILRLVGGGINKAFSREGEEASRIHGDEFVLLIPMDRAGDTQGDNEDFVCRGNKSIEDLRTYILQTIMESTLSLIPEDDLSDEKLENIYKEFEQILSMSIGIEALNTSDSKGKKYDELIKGANDRMFEHKDREDPTLFEPWNELPRAKL